MKTALKVLFTSAGRRVELLRCFQADAEELGLAIEVHAADLRPGLSSACAAADHSFAVPRCTDPAYAGVLIDYARANAIDVIIPTIDTELQAFAAHREAFAQAGVLVNIASTRVVELARDKLATAQALAAVGVPVPRGATAPDATALEGWQFPLIAKPRGGSSSIGIHTLQTIEEARQIVPTLGGDYLLQEKIQGPEYTVNCFYDRDGKLRSAVPHRRIEVRAGEVSKGVTERREDLMGIASQLEQLGGLFGAICFQAILTADGPRVFEINARFGGGFPLAHRAGARFSRWLLQMAAGREPDYSGDWTSGLLMLRYDAAMFRET